MPSSAWEGKVDRDRQSRTDAHEDTRACTDAKDLIQLGIPSLPSTCAQPLLGEPGAREDSDPSLGKTKPVIDTPSSTASGTEGGEVLRGRRIFYRMGYLW